ncbi:MAG: SMC-Scp complex subunit ScpB [Candidatus Dadabacteria bacterium]|nr:SMC-Scp complex subunit ScpB [Candidatus Dadabacteria bacterium]NIS09298.1 SMC-Scp complex subunit ScpB [Candidatus Dadabacteria bacterium]NIV40788.1 SMC-Scp complex subunit ScpB [Candidatus Dadabacteria bacterium]NIX14297.1 SMC-Scp complex subunit ScpB [Candidatus Dadabacteria bacterium]NIY20830.1 SMC-Scp complex subunit ScpB [Candidatus Dadabacteria bacterium]
MQNNDLEKAIESIIFISERPVSLKDLSKIFTENNKKEIKEALVSLMDQWKEINRGITLEEVSEGYQFRTKPEYSVFIAKFKDEKPFRLSRAALEVLSIIAYKQPITKIEVDHIRGVDSSGVFGVLLERGYIKIAGRKEVLGRPFIYETTDEFLETFGLKNLKDLPTLKELEEIEESMDKSILGLDLSQ